MIGAARFIVIIDSDAAARKAIGRLLRAYGFRPQGFASAEAFLARGMTLHRLPQGHRSQIARYARYGGLAVEEEVAAT